MTTLACRRRKLKDIIFILIPLVIAGSRSGWCS